MTEKSKPLTAKDVFHGTELVTINVEIPAKLYNSLLQDLDNEVKSGNMSLTIEQLAGTLLQVGYNWMQYKQLKKVFTLD